MNDDKETSKLKYSKVGIVEVGPKERRAIEKMIERAKANPIPLEVLSKFGLSANDQNFVPHEKAKSVDTSTRPPSQRLDFGDALSLCYSVEEQPDGFCGHLSIMVGDGHELIAPQTAYLFAKIFGMYPPFEGIWVEEVEPKKYTVNLVHCHEPRRKGLLH